MGSRWRITSEQNGRESISSVVLADDEWQKHLDIEARLHRLSGWEVAEVRTDDDLHTVAVVARLGPITRVLSARESGPFDDTLT